MLRTIITSAFLITASAAQAGVPFSAWSEQRFGLFGGNDWTPTATSVSVVSQSDVSMLWTALPEQFAGVRNASWAWEVETSVPRTPLDQKGGDDRNLSLYFIFMPADIAEQNRGRPLRRMMNIEEARVLMYAWGGDHARAQILPSPYLGARGRTVAMRPASTGSAMESVDLAADYQRAFGSAPTALVGLALSADSDDTETVIRASLSDLILR